MPKTTSYVKTVKILHYYFTGQLQPVIAQKCFVNQSTVSRCAEKFKEEAVAKGILAAAEEYQVMDEVTALRSLSTDLYKNKITIEEAKAGLKMVVLFNSLDVPPDEYKVLAKALKKLEDPGFPKAGMKLVKLEETSGKDYTDIVKEYEALGEKIAGREKEIVVLKEKQVEKEKPLEKLEEVRKQKETEFAEFLKKAEEQKTAAGAEVKDKLAEVSLTLEKVGKLHPVVEKMNGLGISDEKLDNFVKEHEALRDSLRNTLDDLKQRKNSLSTGWVSKEKELRAVYEKKERLGLIYADLAITKEKYEEQMSILKKKESELLKARTNLDPKVKIELDDLERAMASLEKAIDGKNGKLFLTELGVWVDSIPENWIVGHSIPCVDSWDEPDALIDIGSFQIGEHGPLMTMVDGPVQSNFEVPRETVLRNIRNILKWLDIRVYVFSDRVEIRGFIPTEVIDIPGSCKGTNRGPIIPLPIHKGRGIQGDRFN